ncbi:phosphoribosylanthranilate isomerase [Flavobacterium sp. LC2016-12]|uniref:phosphoribosylanthranilate isomerase n=1 Tax=Flavobacterium sp. LC2016-12 TaxID=2783794 RepID=UPI00188A22A3|nr:phosphoribosylanthranilate isomerase [Flavobacterium sp. LC2016-12]MBF4465459.1 phosphoribosylanthranilate isomerase [Flavobacterium sp. LC2016-12]
MKLKICGMKYPENILEVGTLLPDYMGFIFWEKSARYFNGEIPELIETVKKVGVFVNQSQKEILEKVQKYKLRAVQLHGNESVEFLSELKKQLPKKVQIIKAFSADNDFDFEILKPYEAVCDYFLFDTKGKLPGGNGTTFDWTILKEYKSKKPFFLSGGIGINELKAIEEISKSNLPIYAIDVNSKFEIEPGLKNKNLFSNFKRKFDVANF